MLDSACAGTCILPVLVFAGQSLHGRIFDRGAQPRAGPANVLYKSI
jgi:hypothetical protein